MDLSLNLAQKQVLSQKMRQSAEILQMSTFDLSEYVQEIAMENPVVEWQVELGEESKIFDHTRQKMEWLDASDEQNKRYYQQEWREGQDEWNFKQSTGQSLEEYLLFQINILPLKGERRRTLQFLAQCISSSGYLPNEILEIMMEKRGISFDEAYASLETLQSLEPAGVAARNVKESLLLQLKRSKIESPLCEKIILNHLEDFSKNKLQQIARKLQVKIIDVVNAGEIIKGFNPKPGSGFDGTEDIRYVWADVFVFVDKEEIRVILGEQGVPQIKVGGYYKELLSGNTEDSIKEYISGKIRQAEWVMQCIEKRKSTLLRTTEAVAKWQFEFFADRVGQLQPMRLLDIAEQIGMHESTVSRAVHGKYVQCARGVFPLTYFFSTGLALQGEKQVSTDSVKKQIETLIHSEDKETPLSDRQITEKLEQCGIQISRRTVAKYREAMGIAGASGRKIFK